MRKFGRKTKYKKTYLDEIEKYIASCEDKTTSRVIKTGKITEVEYIIDAKLPTIEGFAIYIGISRKTLYNWEKEHKEFAEALDYLKTKQLIKLINSGISGIYNSTITKLMLSHNHGMKERSDVTTDDEPVTKFNDEQVSRIAERITRRAGESSDTSST